MKQLILLITMCILSLTVQAIKPDKKYIRYPQHMGLIYKPLDVSTSDNYKIETWYFPAQSLPEDNAGNGKPLPYKTLDNNKRPTLIICNGDAGNMSYYQLVLAMVYTANGYNVVTFDWRGFGTSSEFPMNTNYFCYTEMLTDYDAVIKKVAQQPETDTNNIYLLGWSTGGYLSMITTHKNQLVKGCILRGIPTSFEDIIPIIKKEKNKKDENLLIPANFPTDCMPLSVAPVFHKDIMLIVGSEDTRTPPWMAKKIFEKLPAKTVKRMWVANGAKHGGEEAPEFLFLENFLKYTIQFLKDSYSNQSPSHSD